MKKQVGVRWFVAMVVAAGLALGGAPTWADEPPPDDFPPPAKPAESPGAAPPKDVQSPPAESEVEPEAEAPSPREGTPPPPPAAKPSGGSMWSPPAGVPGDASSALPPPQIVRRGAGAARAPLAAPAAPGATAPTPPTGTLPPPPPSGPPAPLAPARTTGTTTAPALPAQPAAPAELPRALAGSRVFGVSKSHNIPLPGGDLALQMDVDYEVVGQAGRDVYVAIWFVRTDTGAHIRAAMSTYADTTGFVTLQTRSARVEGASARFTATLKIPYRAFPVAQVNDSYEIEARVQILRDDGSGRATSLARGSSTFRVYGSAEPATTATTPTDTP